MDMRRLLKISGIVVGFLVLILLVFLVSVLIGNRIENTRNEERYVQLLKEAKPFSTDVTLELDFRYVQDSLWQSRIDGYFNLDSIIGQDADAGTWETALTIARFVSANIPHANQKVQPKALNSIALWDYTRTVERGINCRLHSIVLHELLLAAGITNRFVTCLPADSADQDCHVVNMVWLPEMDKWAMLDSDMQAYMTDLDGTPLGLQEMRDYYISGKKMKVCPLLGRHNVNYPYYRAYWAKNLYWFFCWEETGYDKETDSRNGGRVVYLVPEGFTPFIEPVSGTGIVIHDVDEFWTSPAE